MEIGSWHIIAYKNKNVMLLCVQERIILDERKNLTHYCGGEEEGLIEIFLTSNRVITHPDWLQFFARFGI